MIPQLWDKTGSYLVAWLADTISCTVTEEKNSTYELKLEYASSGKYALDISIDMLIRCKANQISNLQIFKIYSLETSLTGNVVICAEHISYGLAGYIMPFTTSLRYNSVQDIESYIRTNSYLGLGKYTLSGDVLSTTDYYTLVQTEITSISDFLLSSNGFCTKHNLLCYRNNYDIVLQGRSAGQSYPHITYGVNLADYQCTVDKTSTYNTLLPYYLWKNSNGTVKLITIANNSPTSASQSLNSKNNFVEITPLAAGESYRCLALNVADVVDAEYITDTIASSGQINLKPIADNYIAAHKSDLTDPQVVTTVDFVNLADTENYKNIIDLQQIGMHSGAELSIPHLGIATTVYVVGYEYDTLSERYNSMTLGNITSRLSDLIAVSTAKQRQISNDLNSVPSYIQSKL
ncbi:hypothetical protein ACTQ3L_03910 [Oscillospiraceae bacterium LCP25S3_E4]